ncbi:MAG: 4a-hydroxytetrahydrobiopterin dehydratase [Verrucomicrobia bacterium]|nr:4a-hydroxytetrahydrobiopterin dehydratase [Verrucomicrobiota bacterium]
MPRLNASELKVALALVPAWRKSGRNIVRSCEFADFVAAMKFVNAVAVAAEKANHHPDIDIRWNQVTLALSTHSEGGLTAKDFGLASRIDRLASRFKAA